VVSVVGLDLGGTRLKALLEEKNGTRIFQEGPTGPHDDPLVVLNKCIAIVEVLVQEASTPLEACVIGLPGQVDRESGIFLSSPAILPNWLDIPVRAILEQALGVPVGIDNDVNLALHGERHEGAAQGQEDVLMLTFGTGVGAALTVGGIALRGAFGGAGELGHLEIGCRIPESSFPGSARLGEVASLSGLKRLHAELGKQKHEEAIALLGRAIGYAIETASCIVDPGLVLLGGGLADALGDSLCDSVAKALQRSFPLGIQKLELRLAACGNRAGALGAVATAWQVAPLPGVISRNVRSLPFLPKTKRRAHGGEGELNFCRPFDEENLGSRLRFVDYVELKPGVSIGIHRHGSDEEFYFLHAGEGRMTLDGRTFAVKEGDLIRNPPGGEHGLLAVGGSTLKLLVFDVAGEEQFSWLRSTMEERWKELGCTPLEDARRGWTLRDAEAQMTSILRTEDRA
jgi:glucokinase